MRDFFSVLEINYERLDLSYPSSAGDEMEVDHLCARSLTDRYNVEKAAYLPKKEVVFALKR